MLSLGLRLLLPLTSLLCVLMYGGNLVCGCHLCMAVFCVRSDDTIRGSSQTTSALMFWKKEGENVNGELGMIQ